MATKWWSPQTGWSPYTAGALAGVLIVISALQTGMYAGASTTIVRVAGMLEGLIAPGHVENLEYYRMFPPKVDWQFMFVAGILMGAFLSAITGRQFKAQGVPDMWRERFGPGRLRRGLAAFAGGFVMMVGARLAGG